MDNEYIIHGQPDPTHPPAIFCDVIHLRTIPAFTEKQNAERPDNHMANSVELGYKGMKVERVVTVAACMWLFSVILLIQSCIKYSTMYNLQ